MIWYCMAWCALCCMVMCGVVQYVMVRCGIRRSYHILCCHVMVGCDMMMTCMVVYGIVCIVLGGWCGCVLYAMVLYMMVM